MYAVYGKNKITATEKAQRKLDDFRYCDLTGINQDKFPATYRYVKSLGNQSDTQDIYQEAFNEQYRLFISRQRGSRISKEYECISSAREYLSLIRKEDKTAVIKKNNYLTGWVKI